MNKERAMELMGGIDPALAAEADLPMPAKRRIPKITRTVLIAACLCLALIGTAAAGVAMGWIKATDPSVTQLPHRDGGTVSITEFEVAKDGSVYIPLENFSQEALDYANSFLSLPQYKNFDSWAEAEEFLGIHLADNPVLDKAKVLTQPADPDTLNPDNLPTGAWYRGNPEERKCSVRFEGRTDSPDRIELYSLYLLEAAEDRHMYVGVSADIYTAPSSRGERGSRYQYVDMDVTVEDYVTPSGLQTVIIAVCDPQYSHTFYYAEFSLNGAYYRVSASCFEEDGNIEQMMPILTPVLKEVLDAFS